ncbi:MAG: hypothetical protein KGL95_12670, partial [Patescibacteria group bacterium]|nr:hypothetical protein [Patescibacteria group bacterium]
EAIVTYHMGLQRQIEEAKANLQRETEPRNKRYWERQLSELRNQDKRNAFLNALGSQAAREAYFQSFLNNMLDKEFDKFIEVQVTQPGGRQNIEQRTWKEHVAMRLDQMRARGLLNDKNLAMRVQNSLEELGMVGLLFKEGALNQFDPSIRAEIAQLQQQGRSALRGALLNRMGDAALVDRWFEYLEGRGDRNGKRDYGAFLQEFIEKGGKKNRYFTSRTDLNIYEGLGKESKRKFKTGFVRAGLTASLGEQLGKAYVTNNAGQVEERERLTKSDIEFAIEHGFFFPIWTLVAASNDPSTAGTNWLARIMSPAQFRRNQIGANAFGEYETILTLMHTLNVWDGLKVTAFDPLLGKERTMTMGEFFQGGEGADVEIGRYNRGDFPEGTGSTWYQYHFEGAIQTWELLTKELEMDLGSFIKGYDGRGIMILDQKKAQAAYKILNSMHNLLRKYPPLYDHEIRTWVPKLKPDGTRSGYELKTMTIREYILHDNVLSLAGGMTKGIFEQGEEAKGEGHPEARMLFARLLVDSIRMHTKGRVMHGNWSLDEIYFVTAFVRYMALGDREVIDHVTGQPMIIPGKQLFTKKELEFMLKMAGLPPFWIMELQADTAGGFGTFIEMAMEFFKGMNKAVLGK